MNIFSDKRITKFGMAGLAGFVFLAALFVGAPEARAAISFVGSAANSSSPNTGTSVDVSGIGIAANDLIIVAATVGDTANNGLAAPTEGGYSRVPGVAATLYSNDVNDTNLDLYYKIADGSETTVSFAAVGGNNASNAAIVMVFRGVDTTTPFDTNANTATGINTSNADPPSHNWSGTAGVWTVIAASTGHTGSTAATFTFPTGYTTNAAQRSHNDTIDVLVGMGYKTSPADPEDPAAFSAASVGTAADNAWAAVTMSLKPQQAITTLGSGTDPSSQTIAPGAGATDIDAFTFQTNSGTDSITQVTSTFSADISAGVSEVQITSDNGSTIYGTSTLSGTTATISLSGLTANTTQTQYKIRVVPKSHSAMPAPPGAAYTATATITAWTGTNAQAGSDSNANALTIDNLSPNGATATSTAAGNQQITLNWTTSNSSDFASSVILRWTGASPGSEVPAEGTDYSVNATIGSATVACARTGDAASTAVSGVDGAGTGGCSSTPLTNGQAYSYKVFQKDSRGNYDVGVSMGSATPSAPTITISGTCKQWDQTTNCADGRTIRVAVNGVLQAQSGSTSGGSWSITNVSEPGASGQVVTIFASSTTAAERAVAVTKWVSGNITGVNLIERTLVIGSADNQTVSNANLGVFDNTNDANVFFDVDASNNLNVDVGGLFSDERLLVRSGNTYQPDSSGAQKVITTQNYFASSSATLTANGTVWRLGGNFVNNGTFTQGTSTIEFSGSSSGINCSGCTFYNLTASSTATLTASTSLTVSNTLWSVGTLSIPSGNTVTVPNGATLTLDGTISGAGTLLYRSTTAFPTTGTISSLLTFDATSGNQTISARTYGGAVTIDNSGATTGRTATLGSGTATFSGGLTLAESGSGDVLLTGAANNPTVNITGNLTCSAGTGNNITTGSGTWTVSGDVNFTNCNTVTSSVGNTLVMSGSGTLTSNGKTLRNLTLSGTITLANETHTVAGNLNMAGGTITAGASTVTMSSTSASLVGGGQTLNNLTIDPVSAGTITLSTSDLTVAGTLTVATGDTLSLSSGRTLTHTGATLTLDGTISGAGRLTYRSTTAFPTTGTISSILRFDATAGNQTMSNRTYGGLVEIDNSGATTGRTVTMSAGTHTLSAGLDVAETGSANDVTLTGAANNPTVNITGNLTCSAGTGNNITTGSGTWTVSGDVNFTNCNTVTSSVGNTLVMSGSGTLTSNGKTLRNLTLSGTITLANETHTVAGNLNMAGGTITAGASTVTMSSTSASLVGGGQTLNNLTIDPVSAGTITLSTSDLTVAGTLTVATGDTLSLSSGRTLTLTSAGTLTLDGTISGAGTLLYRSTTAFPTTGTISSLLTFDATSGNQTISARTFGGNVKIDNSGATTGRTVTLGSGTHTFSGNLDIAESGTGDVNLTGSANNPTVNITGNLSCSAGTGNNITTGSGTWTVSGTTVNFTNCLLTSSGGTTLAMNGSSPTLTAAGQTFGSLTFAGATTPIISGNLTASGNVTLVSGMTLTGVTLTMTSSSATLVGAGNTLPNLTVDGTAANVTLGTSDLTVSGTLAVGADDTLTIGSGRTVTAQGTITLPAGGTITGAGRLTITNTSSGPGADGTLSSAVRYDASSANIAATTFDARTYGGAVEVYASSGTAKTVTMNTGTYTFNGGLTVTGDGAGDVTLTGAANNPTVNFTSLSFGGAGGGAKTIAAGSGTWTSTSGNVNFTNGTWTTSAGNTLALSGSGQILTTNNQTFENLNLGGATTPTISGNLTASGTVTLAPNTTLTGVTLTMTGQGKNLVGAGNTLPNLTIDGAAASTTIATSDLTVSDALTVGADDILNIDSGRTLTHTGVSALTLNGTIQGAGRFVYQSASPFPTSGNILSILRFDATNNAQTMSARTYGGQVEVVNTGGANRTVTMASGTVAFNSHLYLYASSTGDLTLDGGTNQATTTVAGNVDFLGGGSGTESIIAGVRPWTISGNLDISGGNFTAPSANLSLAGDYTNTGGTFTHNSGTVILNGSSPQTLSGVMTGSSAFNNLTITNNSGSDPDSSPSVIFNATTTIATSTITTGSVKVRFNASSTYSFSNLNWNGQSTGTRVALRSSISTSTRWFLSLPLATNAVVSNVDVKDSDASSGDPIPAADGTNLDSGGNTNWDFVVNAPTASSTADDVFEINAASTTIANINFRSGTGSPGGRITSSSDIRVRIPAAFPAIWDTTVTSVTCADGNACGKISTTGVTYESSNKIAVINVLQTFLSSEWVQIAGLKMGNFTAVQAATTTHRLRVDGPGDAVDDATDPRTKTVKGKVTHGDHNINQVVNQFDISGTSLTAAELFRFRLTPVGESATITTTTITITGLGGFTSGDIQNPRLYEDTNGDGDIDVGESPLSATGTVSLTGSTGTIVLGGSWTISAATDIILRADVSSIDDGDTFKLSLSPSNISARGATTLENLTVSGNANQVNHGKPRRSFGGGGGAGGGALEGGPPGGSGVGGGGAGGGGAGGESPPPSGGGQGGGGSGGGEGGSAFAPTMHLSALYANVLSAMRSFISSMVSYLGTGIR